MNSKETTETLERSTTSLELLKVESDLGCVLVVGSMVELALENQIAMRLLPKFGQEDELMRDTHLI